MGAKLGDYKIGVGDVESFIPIKLSYFVSIFAYLSQNMIRVLLFITVFFCHLACNNQNERVHSVYENGQVEWLVKFNSNDTTDKTIIGYYEDGTIKCVKNLKNGVEHGEQITYFPNGNRETVCNFSKGVETGEHLEFFQSGKIKFKGEMRDGHKSGTWELYDSKGTKFLREYSLDTLHGLTKEYNVDGSVTIGQYDSGKESGKWIDLNSDSIVTLEWHYRNGLLDGAAIRYYLSGEIKMKGTYNSGKKEGEWFYYDSLGNLSAIEIYHSDSLVKIK